MRSQGFLDQIAARSGRGSITYRSGELRIQLAEDLTYTGVRRQWSFSISAPEGTIVVTIDSVDPGTWSADDSRLSINDFGSEATVTIAVEVGGRLQPLPVPPQNVPTGSVSGSGSYTCDGDVLTTTIDGITATFDRIG